MGSYREFLNEEIGSVIHSCVILVFIKEKGHKNKVILPSVLHIGLRFYRLKLAERKESLAYWGSHYGSITICPQGLFELDIDL